MSAAEIAANNRAFENAVATGNVDAIAALLAPDVMALPPDGPIVTGREAVKQLWASAIKEHGMTSCQITTDQLDVVGDVASEVGHATMTMAPPGGKSETADDQVSGRVEATQRHVAAASRYLERRRLNQARRDRRWFRKPRLTDFRASLRGRIIRAWRAGIRCSARRLQPDRRSAPRDHRAMRRRGGRDRLRRLCPRARPSGVGARRWSQHRRQGDL